ncbi:MAG: sulfatase-like hydrolase/transferase, partial [Lentisphaerae bacterium]|nr:sulfatase-like hydrolase/transferase [Lentisphaerota bacterium]
MCDRPNILYVYTDQQSASAMGCMGNSELSTPVMDRLAAEGALFTQTYCTQPLCTPSRGSMFTGMMPHECGTWCNGESIREDVQSQGLGRLLSAAGYDCAYGGKWHVPQIAMPEENGHGFRRISGFNDHELAP